MMEFISQISLTNCTFQLFTKKCDEDYYKIEQITTTATKVFHKIRQVSY